MSTKGSGEAPPDFDEAITDDQIRAYACGVVRNWLDARIRVREGIAAMLNTEKHMRVVAVFRNIRAAVDAIATHPTGDPAAVPITAMCSCGHTNGKHLDSDGLGACDVLVRPGELCPCEGFVLAGDPAATPGETGGGR